MEITRHERISLSITINTELARLRASKSKLILNDGRKSTIKAYVERIHTLEVILNKLDANCENDII